MANAAVVILPNGQRVFSGLREEGAPNQPIRENQ
jgi:hypothetical protein